MLKSTHIIYQVWQSKVLLMGAKVSPRLHEAKKVIAPYRRLYSGCAE